MKALCVDDETVLLRALVKAVEKSPDIESTAHFTSGKAAIEYAKSNPVDIAFLDIEIHSMNGIELARSLREIHPKLIVIFCTGHCSYALDAFRIHANGYLTKPVSASEVQEQIDNYKKMTGTSDKKKLLIRCFGNFEVFCDGKPLKFKLSRTKELLAYLVDRNGAECKTAEIISVLFEDVYNAEYYSKIRRDLIKTFEDYGLSECINVSHGGLSVNRDMTDCDYFDYKDGKITTPPSEYMTQYSFGEYTFPQLFDV